MIQALVAAGAKVNKLGPGGDAAIHTAAWRDAAANIRQLAKSGADVNLKNRQGETALLQAIDARSPAAVKALLDVGADPNIADRKGNTAVHLAAKTGDIKMTMNILPQLLRHGGKVELKNKDGDTPLQVVLFVPEPERRPIAQFLLDAGANPNIQDALGDTPLHHIAAQQIGQRQRDQLIPLLEMLIKAGANINAQNKDGETPLYKSVFEACFLNVKPTISSFLLQHGADKRIKLHDGSSAADLIHAPELHCNLQVRQLLAGFSDKQGKTEASKQSGLSALIKTYAEQVDQAGREYQQAKQAAVRARGFSGLSTRQAVQSRQKLFADFRDNTTRLIFLFKDAKKLIWKAVQKNKIQVTRQQSDAAVTRKFGNKMTEDGLGALKVQFYWADAYFNAFTLLDQHWGKWRVDEKLHRVNIPNKIVQDKFNKELQVIEKMEKFMRSSG